MSDMSPFKAYDVRGRFPHPLSPSLAYATGVAFARTLSARNVVVGRDARLSGPVLQSAVMRGLADAGAAVTDIGMCGTEEVYYAAGFHGFDGGIMVTGSHNPADENGLKLVRAGAVPVSGDSGLDAIRDCASSVLAEGVPSDLDVPPPGIARRSFRDRYCRFLVSYVGCDRFEGRRLRLYCDAGNGCAGLLLASLRPFVPFDLVIANGVPDGTFPGGIPNPLLPERRTATSSAVVANHADIGIAWDGDFDRCFFYDENGRFIEGYYIVGLLAKAMLARFPSGRIIHDPRLIWNTVDVVSEAGGVPVMSKTGHAFIKERMRAEDAVYGGEMSAHHYFRDFRYCDNGTIPWLLVADLVARSGKPLSELVGDRMRAFPCSGEINSRVPDAASVVARVHDAYAASAVGEDRTDGLSMDFGAWRFNLRPSNTEPLLRLNVESRGDEALMSERTAALLRLIRG